ncbi:MAG: hypothetical protein WC603_01415 [Candidatus Paceibacterota bacterium]|jgi:hypothetical protein
MSYNDDEEIKIGDLEEDTDLDDDLGEPIDDDVLADDDLLDDEFAGLDGSAEY